DRIDLFHSPLGLPLLSTTPGIATIHDVCFLSCPGIFTRRMRAYFRLFLPLSIRRARLVVTVSHTSRDALVRHLGVPTEKIRVVPNGIADHFRPVHDPGRLAAVRERYGLPESFILYAGTRVPRAPRGGARQGVARDRGKVGLAVGGGPGIRPQHRSRRACPSRRLREP